MADLNNVSTTQFAGSIIAALFLKRFVTRTRNWLHGDVYAWNPKERPAGRWAPIRTPSGRCTG